MRQWMPYKAIQKDAESAAIIFIHQKIKKWLRK
jgi:hypothetical protein